jgi:hypothetical protein
MLPLVAPASSLSLSQTGSDTQFWDRNLAVVTGTLMTHCWLIDEYSLWLISAQKEQVVMQ